MGNDLLAVKKALEDASVDALQCMGCARMKGIEWEPAIGGTITCQVDEPAASSSAAIPKKADFAEAAARRKLHEVVSPITVMRRSSGGKIGWRRMASLRVLPDLTSSFTCSTAFWTLGLPTRPRQSSSEWRLGMPDR